MRLFANLSLGKLCGKGSKANGNQIKSSKDSFSDDPSRSDKRHFDDPTQSHRNQSDDPTQSDQRHSDDQTQSDIKQSDDPAQSEGKHSDEPTQSDGKTSDDPAQSDGKPSDEPTQSDKEHSNDQTRNGMSTLLNFPLKDIKSVTNNFDDESFIGEGFLGKIYGGQVSLSGELTDVAVRRLDNSFQLQELAFEKEISILSRLEHPNIVSIVGYCYENNEMLIVSKRVARGSLRWHLSDHNLTWMRRLQISIGVVFALSYLHNGAGHNISVIHHNINCDSILLDEEWEAKISGFEYSMTIPATGLDLAYEKLGIGTYKSDVFSIGVVLFEILCGREAFVSKDTNSFQASLAIYHYEDGKLHKKVDPGLYNQMDQLSFKIFSETAYNCLIRHRAPTMNEVLKRLERALKVQQMHDSNEDSTVTVQRTIPDHLKLKLESLEHMRIPFTDIELATKNFSKGCIVSSGGYGSVYTAELDHVDKRYCFPIEGANEREGVSKKRSTVAIKRIMDTENEIAEQGFYAEIEMLTSCKHSNIITLFGFCDEGGKLILIYEYASNKSLSDYLQKTNKIHNDSWAQRVKICIDVAKGLSFLRTTEGDRQEIVHRDIKSANILLDENFEAKIGDFGLSVFLSVSKDTRYSRTAAGTLGYVDPQYWEDAKLKKELDIYSFGVVLFEILFGTVAYDTKYSNKELALMAKQHFNKGTIKEMVDPKIKEEITKTIFTSFKGPSQESLDTYSKIAYDCLAEAQGDRPTMENVVKELEKALYLQENRTDVYKISLEDIRSVTDCLSRKKKQRYTKVTQADGTTTNTIVKRYPGSENLASLVGLWGLSKRQLEREFGVLRKYKHENVIALLGYCEEGGERIAFFEHMSNGSLQSRLNDSSLTWGKRLKICIDIASGLAFLHGGSTTGEVLIHRNISSRSILLDSDMKAKIANFGASFIHPIDLETVRLGRLASQRGYLDPEYKETHVLSKECDIYSFGVVLFEILLQRDTFTFFSKKGDYLGHLIKDLYKKGKLDEMMFEGSNQQIALQSLTIYKRIAIQCLSDKREDRPTAREVIIQLKQALEIQERGIDMVRISLKDIKDATDSFSDEKYIGRRGFWDVYVGKLLRANGQKIVAAKRLDRRSHQGNVEFYGELNILFKFKHRNVINLEGFCEENNERIIVYEYASNGSLDRWLKDSSLTWMKRLEIGIGIASGLDFLHEGVLREKSVIHRDVKSSNILLSGNWEAKITDFELSWITTIKDDGIKRDPVGTPGYIDPVYQETRTISKASDIYTFGVVLFEMLCGELADNQGYLSSSAKNYYEQRKLDELVFEGIKEQIMPQSLSTFADIAYKCLHHDRHQRPTAAEVVTQLKEAQEFQRLPRDYKEIIQQSRTPEIYNTKKKMDLYNMLCEGILIQKGRVWFSLDSNNKRNEMISATLFTYQNQRSRKWKHNRKSRFQRVSLMMDISNLKIQAKIKAQFLTPSVTYGVYLVFKFVEPTKISSKPKYVNLKYKMGNETLHAYFATWRKDKWMMIELYRFLSNKDGGDFEVLLESFSRCYCGNGRIYIEGIEFRAIDYVTYEETEKSKDAKQITRSNSIMSKMQPYAADIDETLEVTKNSDEPIETNEKKHHMLSAKEVLYDSSNVKLFKLKPSDQSSRYIGMLKDSFLECGEVIEVLSQQVFRIKCKIESQILSPDTDYRCYLIFKLSEKCCGLHCPVKVRGVHRPVKVEGQLHQSSKETKDLYFRTPKEWNIHDINQVPKQREDGWIEVNVWKFNSKDQLRNDCIHLNLKLISYEGTMSGLIVCGLELQPM